MTEERNDGRRGEDHERSEVVRLFKRYTWVWPLAAVLISAIGFRWVSPSGRLGALEAQAAQVPDSIHKAIHDSLAPIVAALELARVQDSLAEARLSRIERVTSFGVALQCRDLSARELALVRELAQVCTQTARSSGIPLPP